MNVFIDSSLLVEYEKLNRPELLEALMASNHQLFINPIVASEYLYQLIGILGGRSPMSICESGKIGETLGRHDTAVFLSAFEILSIPDKALPMAIDLMKKHNLLPNDAIILASCKLEQVAVLASFDTDFSAACRAEGIQLICEVADFS
ncbi:MAG: PIN domain-containing protein [Haliscomenobacter sp.]|nr:PIN domain-containing protein [Haliscomenobacter sp.]